MNDLLFIALLIALLYYFFIYLPSTKKSNPDPSNKPFTHPKSKPNNPDPKKTNPKETSIGPRAVEFPSNETIAECPGTILIGPEAKSQSISQEDKQELEKVVDDMI